MLKQNIKRQSSPKKLSARFLAGLFMVASVVAGFSLLAVKTSPVHAACATPPPAAPYGTVTMQAAVPAATTYKIWSRIKIPDTTNNSYVLMVKDMCTFGGTIATATVGSWVWVAGSTTAVLPAGSTPVGLYGTKNGVSVDRVLLVADLTCIPTGTGDNCANIVANQPPTVSLSAPANGATVAGGTTVALAATAADDVAVSKVEFYIDSVLQATDTASPYSASWTAPTTAGSHVVQAKAYDGAGLSATASATVNVTAAPATVPGDCNGPSGAPDGRVNAFDLSLLLTHDGQAFPECDFDHNGTIGAADVAILLGKWTW